MYNLNKTIILNPDIKDWDEICKRPSMDYGLLEKNVSNIIKEVRQGGDSIIKKYSEQFDGIYINEIIVSEEEFNEASAIVSDNLKNAIQNAYNNITTFHKSQLISEEKIETQKGVLCWRKSVGIEKVGLYIPGGTAPLFSTVLMLGIPARIAKCREIILCTPPNKDGKISPEILYAAELVGISKIYKVGGAQAIASMAYGTETVPSVYKIFGPGNQYVTMAKTIVARDMISIDMPAGPSEVMIIADSTSNPRYIAADMLSQAEHGVDSQSILVCNDKNVITNIIDQIQQQAQMLDRQEILYQSLQNFKFVFFKEIDRTIDFLNYYAPEHLILMLSENNYLSDKIINAGSVFVGEYSPESAGDYASGTNHTLPTSGYARTYSGVSLDSFVKKITFQQISAQGLKQIADTIETMAEAEKLSAHKNAVRIRINELNSKKS